METRRVGGRCSVSPEKLGPQLHWIGHASEKRIRNQNTLIIGWQHRPKVRRKPEDTQLDTCRTRVAILNAEYRSELCCTASAAAALLPHRPAARSGYSKQSGGL